MNQDELFEIVKEETNSAISNAQVLAAMELQSCQGDLVLASNAIIRAAITGSVTAVLGALARAGVLDGPQDPPSGCV